MILGILPPTVKKELLQRIKEHVLVKSSSKKSLV